MAIPEDLVDRAYEKAGIDFNFFEPIYHNNTKARDGLINLDEIVKQATEAKLLRGQGDIVNVIFVNAVDGKKGPLGRGMMGGNITFIALGPTDKKESQRTMEAFVIAHEVGHNLSLSHVVSDPNMAKDVPNIMGDGPFEQRIDPTYSLTPYQIDIILKSRCVHPRVDLLSLEEGKEAILDESFESYFSNLLPREIAAFTTQKAPTESIEKAREIARERSASAVLEFTSQEKSAITAIVAEVNKILLANNIMLMAHHPWRFIKIANWLCGGFAHTRGTSIILSEGRLNSLTKNWNDHLTDEDKKKLVEGLGSLIVHGQMHCLQRTHPSAFETLYTQQWGFVKANVESNSFIIKNQLSNPDAPRAEWIIPDGKEKDQFYWIRTILREGNEIPEMGKDFIETVFKVAKHGAKYTIVSEADGAPKTIPMTELKEYAESYPIKTGIDHPNEISAYMFGRVFRSCLQGKTAFAEVKPTASLMSKLFIEWVQSTMK